MKINNPTCLHKLDSGIESQDVIVEKKTYGQLKSAFNSIDESIPEDTVMYEVERISVEDSDVLHGLTKIYPILVNGECNMTKGHFHANDEIGEFYYCKKGKGLLMLMDKEGNTYAQKMFPGSVHLIPVKTAHRCINTSSNEVLEIACIWTKLAGYDYDYIVEHPFKNRVYLENGEMIIK